MILQHSIENDYVELQRLDIESLGMLCSLLVLSGDDELTTCPRCGLDSFVHTDACDLPAAAHADPLATTEACGL